MFTQEVQDATRHLPKKVYLWVDPLPRRGYANMAADELLTRRPECWLRIYGWSVPAVSFGYFDTATEASAIFPGLRNISVAGRAAALLTTARDIPIP